MTRVEVYRRSDGAFDWRLVAGNGEILCGSDQGYTERNDAREGWQRVSRLIFEGEEALKPPRVVDVD